MSDLSLGYICSSDVFNNMLNSIAHGAASSELKEYHCLMLMWYDFKRPIAPTSSAYVVQCNASVIPAHCKDGFLAEWRSSKPILKRMYDMSALEAQDNLSLQGKYSVHLVRQAGGTEPALPRGPVEFASWRSPLRRDYPVRACSNGAQASR